MILVTGGTGLVGSHLLYFLTTSGHKVRALFRTSSTLMNVEKVFAYYTDVKKAKTLLNSIDWFEADITNIPRLSKAFNNCTQVYHCAAIIDFDPNNYELLKKVNVEGTANIVNLSLVKKIEKLCYVSSIITLGNTADDSPICEETDFNHDAKNNIYAITKYAAEMEVWRGIQEGLAAVIVNPGIILGAGFWNSGSGVIVPMVAKGMPYYTNGSEGIVDVQDVVHSMQLLMDSTITNERYLLVGANVSYRELINAIASALQKKPPTREVAAWVLYIVSAIDKMTSVLLGSKRKLLKETVHSLYNQSSYSSEKIETALGIQFSPFNQTIERVVSRYKIDY